MTPGEAQVSEPDRPVLRVVRGEPTAEELAVVTALVTARGSAGAGDDGRTERRGRWNDPAARVRRYWRPGPGGWQAAGRG